MIPNPYPGKFFVFEGIDGCGKTKQLETAEIWLRTLPREYRVVKVTKEPGRDRFWGTKIYEDLAKPGGLHTHNLYGFQAWYACDSKEHMRRGTIRDLEVGNVVLCDRYRHSMVYGVSPAVQTLEERRTAIEKLMQLNQAIMGEDFIWPDTAFIFDVSVPTAISRLQEKFKQMGKGYFDGHEREAVLNRVSPNYLLFAQMYPNCCVINAERMPEKIFEDVKKIILAVLEAKNKPT